MAGGRIQHWKHGWIPLTPAALRSKLKQGPPPKGNSTGGTLTNAERRKIINMEREANGQKPLPSRGRVSSQADRIGDTLARGRNRPVNREAQRAEDRMKGRVAKSESLIDAIRNDDLSRRVDAMAASERKRMIDARVAASTAEMERERYEVKDVVDGVEFVTYKPGKDPLGLEHGHPFKLDEAQKAVLAETYNQVMREFPDAEPVTIVGVESREGAFGITSWDGRRISISKDLFTDQRRRDAAASWGDVGAVAALYTSSPEAFARVTLIHELGHALQMQKVDVRRAGEVMAREKIQARDLGIVIPPEKDKPDQFTRIKPSEKYAPRFAVDTLDNQSVYATANEYEWFAEAFTEGWLNKAGATPSGKRALELIRQSYGGQQKIEEAA